MTAMADTIDKIPEQSRWEIATRGLTGAYIAISKALRQALGQKGFDDFNGPLWYQAGKGAMEFTDTYKLPTGTAKDIEAVTHALASASMGPEFVFEVVEAGAERCVGRTTQCPWHKRWKEQGIDFDSCGAGHQRWGDGAVESLNPQFSFKLTKNMLRGDSYCEWVVERKK
jgi:L-2-amino-thiazoline-4-carboxylic acid hydrolase